MTMKTSKFTIYLILFMLTALTGVTAVPASAAEAKGRHSHHTHGTVQADKTGKKPAGSCSAMEKDDSGKHLPCCKQQEETKETGTHSLRDDIHEH